MQADARLGNDLRQAVRNLSADPCAAYVLHPVWQYLFSRIKSAGYIASLKQVQHPRAIPDIVRRNRLVDDVASESSIKVSVDVL